MQEQLLDFADSDELAGFRLQRLEVYNWGTFHQRVWHLELDSRNALLTGEIGSGKSTIVDAVTTLLVPAQRITYNKAAGSGSRERSLRTYIQGFYKSERSEHGHAAKPVALRDHNSYSVVLAVFNNSGFGQTVTLAQVFWSKDLQGQPSRFYLISSRELTIAKDFADFGTDLKLLRKRLRNLPHVELFDSFPPYAAVFRRRMGIKNDQAMELFNQTVSIKSVGNLTDFVRTHMLENPDASRRIEALISHFDNLNRSHEAILKAKKQIGRLTPLVADCKQYRLGQEQSSHWQHCRNGLKLYFAMLKQELLSQQRATLEATRNKLSGTQEALTKKRAEQQADRDHLKQAIADNGGDRLARIKQEIQQKNGEKARRLERAGRYQELARRADFSGALTLEAFFETQNSIQGQQGQLGQEEAALQNSKTEHSVTMQTLRQQHAELREEIISLQKRRSNIDSKQIAIRKALCAALDIAESEIPFAGELIKVKDEEKEWEGAAERVLHSFGLSLLVHDRNYSAVAKWVDNNDLKGRLVYFRVRDDHSTSLPQLSPQSLVHRLEIKPNSEFYLWLNVALCRRFDYVCCENLADFRRQEQAITKAGQIKTHGQRHEKDDRYHLSDRSRYILGWSNESKIATLSGRARTLKRQIQRTGQEISAIQEKLDALTEKKTVLVQLGEFREFSELHWQELAASITDLESECKDLESASNILKTLSNKLTELETSMGRTESDLDTVKGQLAQNELKLQQNQTMMVLCREIITAASENERTALFTELEILRAEALGNEQLEVASCDNLERNMRDWLQQKIDNQERKLKTLSEKIIRAMQDFCRDFPLETQEIDAHIEGDSEFAKMLYALKADDLPRFEKRFKELLNENTIREIANFQSHLHRERETIKERIDIINQSLTEIEYNPGRYIILEAQHNPDHEIKEFQQQLRACTEGALTGSEEDQYAESKFLQVKAIIERFQGREGCTDLDKRWSAKVTDVRRWFEFAASERWQEDHSEYEHYTDSSGKSGGQKEKLAYTVLAASLAYQFGLEWGAVRSRSFRFVVIDEAFGRGSDESTRYGLELFKKLNLQLLIVTPMQKIHIIEPYISAVGFVHNEEGRQSMLRNLTIEEYKAEKEAHIT